MAVYAVGDLQGCLTECRKLLDRLDFDPGRDRLWLVGDIVNRGPESLEALRFVKELGDAAITVLGNHDLNLLAVAYGDRRPRKKDTLTPILEAPDREELLDWLRHQPLFHHDPALDFAMVHAGLPPEWDLTLAKRLAREVEAALQGPDFTDLLADMYGDQPDRWHDDLSGMERLRFAINCFTRMRYCTPEGRLRMKPKGPPGTQGADEIPWFEVPGRRTADQRIVFGHWSTLGALESHNAFATDTGCVWGGKLTALRLDTTQPQWLQVECAGALEPGAD